jgi:hypothetical protein
VISARFREEYEAIFAGSRAAGAPDEYAWRLFVQVNAPAGVHDTTCADINHPSGTSDGSSDVCWQRWADVFEDVLDKSQYATLTWPDYSRPHKELTLSPPFLQTYFAILKHQREEGRIQPDAVSHPTGQAYRAAGSHYPALYAETLEDLQEVQTHTAPKWLTDEIDGTWQEITFNKETFEYINDKHLWYREGLKGAFKCSSPISFPPKSLAVKALWQVVTNKDLDCGGNSPLYHCVQRGDQTLKLLSLHIIAKLLPSWLWATWEHRDNQGGRFCQHTPCVDTFGYTQGPKGAASECLKELLRPLGPEWQNYRLHGAQTSFRNGEGDTLLGNSMIEAGITDAKLSSCMSCHTEMTMNEDGDFPNVPSGFVGEPDVNTLSESNRPFGFLWSLARAKCRKQDDCRAESCPQ